MLTARVPRTLEATRDWAHAHPYTLRHLATHAAAAGTLDPLLAEAGYLVHADPDTLLPALDAARRPPQRGLPPPCTGKAPAFMPASTRQCGLASSS